MALSDRINQRPRPKHGRPCSVGKLLDELKGAERDALLEMLGDPVKRDGWSAADIFETLLDEGHRVGFQTINRHRGGTCRCAQQGNAA